MITIKTSPQRGETFSSRDLHAIQLLLTFYDRTRTYTQQFLYCVFLLVLRNQSRKEKRVMITY